MSLITTKVVVELAEVRFELTIKLYPFAVVKFESACGANSREPIIALCEGIFIQVASNS